MSRVANRLRFIEPQLASPVDQPPDSKAWIHEINYDGYRCQVLLERGKARVFTRNGYDWTDRYPSIVRAVADLRCRSAIIDGEAIVQDDNGNSDFEGLSAAMRRQRHNIILYAFDLLHLDGQDLRLQTLSERRAQLERLVVADDGNRIQFSEPFDGDAKTLFSACVERGLEGIVSKHSMSRYQSGRSRTWLKTKCFTETQFVVIGMDYERKTGAPIALLGRHDSDGFIYAGWAFIALDGDERREFLAEVERLTGAWAAFKSLRQSNTSWCEPKLTVLVKHLAGSKTVRHATVKGLVR